MDLAECRVVSRPASPLIKLKQLAHVRVSNVDKHSSDDEQLVRLCNYVDVYRNDLITDNMPFTVATASVQQVDRFGLQPGDVVFTKDSETADDIGVPALVHSASADLVCGYHLAIARPKRAVVDPSYLFWALSSHYVRGQWKAAATGITRVGLRLHDLRRVLIPLPELPVQRQIAEHLAVETVKIDSLILVQQELMIRLRERAQALIDTVPWAGLSGPDVQACASGIEPAPNAPAHWRRVRNRDLLRERTDLSTTGEERMLSVSHLTGVTPRSEKNVNMFEAASTEGYRLVSPGQLVINTMWAWMGALGVARHEGIVSPAYGVYRFTEPVDPRYFEYLYRSRPYVAEMTRYSRGIWSSRLRLYPASFLRLNVVVPPTAEQTAIADLLDAETRRIRALIQTAEQVITVAKERRAALITAAITGQIDVRKAA